MRRLVLIIGFAAALGLGACGGDDNKNGDNASTTTATTETTGTSTGKTTDDRGANKGKDGSGDSTKGSGKSGSGSGGSGGGSSGGGGGSGTTTGGDKTTSTTGTQTGDQPTPTAPSNLQPTPFKTAKKVCGDFLPVPIQKQVKSGKISKETVAKNYSKGYPEGQRGEARKGCLAGLKTL
jgi:hypothetical protein